MKSAGNLLKRLLPVDTINIPVELLIGAGDWRICDIFESGDYIVEAIFNHVGLFAGDISVSITDFEFNIRIGNAGFKFFWLTIASDGGLKSVWIVNNLISAGLVENWDYAHDTMISVFVGKVCD